MADLLTAIEQHKDMTDAAAKHAGQAIAGSMSDEHRTFAKTITSMLQTGTIDSSRPETILRRNIYDQLPFSIRGKVDFASVNILHQLRRVAEFYASKHTPDESPQLATMIEELWQMKARVEARYGDVFVF